MVKEKNIPHFANDEGLAEIRIGVKSFRCIGASAPFDHPHVFLEMGAEDSIVCPYCATRYIFASSGAGAG